MTDTRGRPTRREEVATERRRRDDATIDGGRSLKLSIPPDIAAKLAAQGRTPRWANDVDSRLYDLTVRDDWDKVEGVAPRTVVIDKKKGTTAQAYLLSKRTDFIDDDRAKMERVRSDKVDAMLKGQVPGGQPAANTYADSANRIERRSQSIE